jgi:hypothetical protein
VSGEVTGCQKKKLRLLSTMRVGTGGPFIQDAGAAPLLLSSDPCVAVVLTTCSEVILFPTTT